MTKRKSSLVPDYIDLINPTFTVIKNLGGTATNNQIHDGVVELLRLSKAAVSEKHINKNETELIYRLRWVRTAMKKSGVLINQERSIWTILPGYRMLDAFDQEQLDFIMKQKQVVSSVPVSVELSNVTISDVINNDPDETPWVTQLRDALMAMNPYSFETLCKLILEKCGITDVSTTKKSKDGGIDGYGRLKLNTIFSVNIAFQCKHYGGKISAPAIRNFRGAMSPNIEMGLFITTSEFTQAAIDEANRVDQKMIHIMDGEQIIQYLLDCQIGCTKQEVYIIDEDFFKNL